MRQAATTLLAICFTSTVTTAFAAPSARTVEVLRHADGSTFDGVTRGDEWRSWVETTDGFTVARAADGNWYYVRDYRGTTAVLDTARAGSPPPLGLSRHRRPAPSLPRASTPQEQRRAAARTPVGPFTGPLLFILAEFSDQAGATAEANWAAFVGTDIVDYYDRVSHGAAALSPATESFGAPDNGVVGWLNLGYPHPNTADNTASANQQLARDAILAADPYVDYASYDGNGDGYIDADELAVVVIPAGYERSYSANYAPSVWGHMWSISCCGGAPVVDGVVVADWHQGAGGYAQFGELHRSNSGNAHQATMGIMVHELGHLIFGLPDLYDIDDSSAGIGVFGLMSSGSWGAAWSDSYAGTTPVAPCAWSKTDRGWVDAAAGAGTVAVVAGGSPTADSANAVFRSSTLLSNEYFLVENRQDSGYDSGLERFFGPGFAGGVAVWHIDDDVPSNSDDSHRKVDLEEADGTESSGALSDFWFVGNATVFDDASIPSSKLYDGSSSGKSIEVLDAPGDTMNVVFDAPLCGNGVVGSGENCDDGNTTPGDGCDGSCQIEPCYICSGVPSSCTLSDGAPCDDGVYCNGADSCQAGACTVHAGDPCAGGSECADQCDEAQGSCFALAGTACSSDGNPCNGAEQCDGSGLCVPTNIAPDCSDANPCSVDRCDPAFGCTHEAAATAVCYQGSRTSFLVKDRADDAKDRLSWKLSRGEAFGASNFGTPQSSTGYALCVYDRDGGVPSLATSLELTPSLSWQSKGWRGYKYRDPLGAIAGIRNAQLKTGEAGKGIVRLRAKGSALPTPSPLDPSTFFLLDASVTVVLLNSEGACWRTDFSAADVKKNDGQRFKAKTP